jgi:hypothetical protein
MTSLHGQLRRSTEKRGGAGQCNVVENDEVEVPFIVLERGGGGSRSEELDGGRGVRFEVSRFEDEGDMVRRRFIGQKEGGRAALRFGSPCAEEGTTSGGAWRGNTNRAGGGSSGVRGKETMPEVGQAGRLDGPPWRGGPRWATAMAGRKNEKKTGKNLWASTEHGPN